jgi:hypothetical protein
MKCPQASGWAKQASGAWVARDPDGYTLRVVWRKGSWQWSVRPPGGGYDVYTGSETDCSSAQQRAEAALQSLMAEILASRSTDAPPGGRS